MTAHVALAGGGLANCLIALRLCQRRPDVRLTLIEAHDRLGGNHLWSFHDSDLTADQRREMEALVVARWPHQEVRFPSLERRLDTGYNSIRSPRLAEVVGETLAAAGHRVLLGATITDLDARSVTLADGERLEAELVLDGRGARPSQHLSLAYQKFVGLHLELDRPHELDGPILMDATVEQRDGYRFLYTLPLGDRRLLVEDTRYADEPDLDHDELRTEIRDYATTAGWGPREVVHEEHGVLPIVLGGDVRRYWSEAPPGVPSVGLRALLFHPTTGYSLPEAVRLAVSIASTDRLESDHTQSARRRHASSTPSGPPKTKLRSRPSLCQAESRAASAWLVSSVPRSSSRTTWSLAVSLASNSAPSCVAA